MEQLVAYFHIVALMRKYIFAMPTILVYAHIGSENSTTSQNMARNGDFIVIWRQTRSLSIQNRNRQSITKLQNFFWKIFTNLKIPKHLFRNFQRSQFFFVGKLSTKRFVKNCPWKVLFFLDLIVALFLYKL